MNSAIDDNPSAVLDISGFSRRLPKAAIRWQLAQLPVGHYLTLILTAGLTRDDLQTALQHCDARIVAEQLDKGRLHLFITRRRPPLQLLELDMRGRRCPTPIIEARRQLRQMGIGEQLRMRTDCTGIANEVDTWTTQNPHVALLNKWRQCDEQVFLLGRS